jgi:site-specific recombinase XerC
MIRPDRDLNTPLRLLDPQPKFSEIKIHATAFPTGWQGTGLRFAHAHSDNDKTPSLSAGEEKVNRHGNKQRQIPEGARPRG